MVLRYAIFLHCTNYDSAVLMYCYTAVYNFDTCTEALVKLLYENKFYYIVNKIEIYVYFEHLCVNPHYNYILISYATIAELLYPIHVLAIKFYYQSIGVINIKLLYNKILVFTYCIGLL